MPIILICGDEQHIFHFIEDFKGRIGQTTIHPGSFHEAISDVCQRSQHTNNLITQAYTRSDRYIAFCNARKFNTQYLVVFLDGNCPDALDIPSENVRHDNPFIIASQYEKEDKNMFFERITQILSKPFTKKQNKKLKPFSADKISTTDSIFKKIQSKYPFNEEIFLETENIMMRMLMESKRDINVEVVYEKILLDSLRERGLIDP